jgi:ABC-type sugar transport system permease subunit/outer membrane protein assembly factor BamB
MPCQRGAGRRDDTARRAGRPLLALLGALAVSLAGHGLALAQEDVARFKARDIVYAVAVAPDGDGLVVGSRDSSVYRLDPSGAVRWEYRTGGTVYGVALGAGKVAVASEDQHAYLLDSDGAVLWRRDAGTPLNGAAISPDGALVAAATDGGHVLAWDAAGRPLWDFFARVKVTSVAVLADGRGVVAGTRDSSVYLLDAGTGGPLWQQQLNDFVSSVAARPDGALIVAGTDDGAVAAFDLGGGQLWEHRAPDKVHAVAVSADGAWIAVGGQDEQVSILDRAGQLVRRHRAGAPVRAVAIAADGGLVVAGTEAGEVQVYGAAEAAAASSAGGRLAASLSDRFVSLAAGGLAVLGLGALIAFGQRDFRARRGRSLPVRIWRARLSYLFLLPTCALLLVFSYYPALSGLLHSFTDWHIGGETRWVGLDNFRHLLDDRYFTLGIGNLAILTVAHFAKVFTAPLLVAELIFNLRPRALQYWARTAFVIPTIVPGVVLILLWLMIYEPSIGLLNQSLRALGLGNLAHAWLGESDLALASIVAIGLPWVYPFAFLVYYGGLIAIPTEVLEAARVDGCTTFGRVWRIDLPLLLGQIKLLLVLGFIGQIQDFGLILLTTGGGPGDATYVPALQLYYAAMRQNQLGYASAIATVLFLVILGGTLLNLRLRSAVEYQA